MTALRDWTLRPRDLLELVPRLATLKRQRGINLQLGDSIGYYGAPDKVLRGRGWRGRREMWQGCQAGMQAIGIEADGSVKGCLSLQAKWGDGDPFVEGNLRQASLDQIWHRQGVFAFNRDFDPRSLTGFCATCRYSWLCRGGARCVSSAYLGSLTEDPYCYYRVATLQQRARRRARVQPAASAMAALLLALGPGACGDSRAVGEGDAAVTVDARSATDVGSGSDARGAEGDATLPADAALSGDLGVDATAVDATPDLGTDAGIDCSTVCCMCDYGIIPDDVWEACCTE
jgi:radical SAM protein with 4Fe4S-binding SPASM domain